MPLVFLSQRLKEEEQSETKFILEKYSDCVEYTEILHDSNIDLIIRTKNDILSNQVYKTLTVTFPCLRQMDKKGINPFLFQPRNIGLRNIFLLGKKISLYKIEFSKPIINLIRSMGGIVNELSDPNNADIIITDKKYKSENFSVPLVRSSWIYTISNQTLETPYTQFEITNENPISHNVHLKFSSQLVQSPKIKQGGLSSSSSQIVSIPVINEEATVISVNKKENISASLLNIANKKARPQKRRNILNCIRPPPQSSQAIIIESQSKIGEAIACPIPNDINFEINSNSPIKEIKTIKLSELNESNNNESDFDIEVDFKKDVNKKKIIADFPVPDTPEKILQNSPKRAATANLNHTVSPKLNEMMQQVQILTKKSQKKHQKSMDNIRSVPSIEELNDFYSQITHDDDNEDDVYYDNTKETQGTSEQHSTQMDEEALFRMLD